MKIRKEVVQIPQTTKMWFYYSQQKKKQIPSKLTCLTTTNIWLVSSLLCLFLGTSHLQPTSLGHLEIRKFLA